jgi:hypothetical protein
LYTHYIYLLVFWRKTYSYIKQRRRYMKKLYLFALMLVMSGCAMAPGFTLNGIHMPDVARSWTPEVVCDFVGGCLEIEEPRLLQFNEFDEVVNTEGKVQAVIDDNKSE